MKVKFEFSLSISAIYYSQYIPLTKDKKILQILLIIYITEKVCRKIKILKHNQQQIPNISFYWYFPPSKTGINDSDCIVAVIAFSAIHVSEF